MTDSKETVLIVGASSKEERYSNKAQKMLVENGHEVVLLSPKPEDILGVTPHKELSEINQSIDTITMYVSPRISSPMVDEFIRLNPKRVIFNPGTENPELQTKLTQNGIKCQEACTLVLLRSGQY